MIRKANPSDKQGVMKFCENTFSWGDYIKDVWDYWLSEGNLHVFEKNKPVGISHAVFLKNHVWIEGIRVAPEFRRQGLASRLIENIESLAVRKNICISLMLIDTQNSPSLYLAQKSGYIVSQTWNFYSLLPKKKKSENISFEKIIKENDFPHYVKSWRWISLDDETISVLESENRIIHSGYGADKTMAILEDSEHFKKTLIVTLFAGSKNTLKNIISFLQNYGFEKNYERLQILTKEELPKLDNLDCKISFHLMRKLLS